MKTTSFVISTDRNARGSKENDAISRKAIVSKQPIQCRGLRRPIDVETGTIRMLNHDQTDGLGRAIGWVGRSNLVNIIGRNGSTTGEKYLKEIVGIRRVARRRNDLQSELRQTK
jgi:hypothetical protein